MGDNKMLFMLACLDIVLDFDLHVLKVVAIDSNLGGCDTISLYCNRVRHELP